MWPSSLRRPLWERKIEGANPSTPININEGAPMDIGEILGANPNAPKKEQKIVIGLINKKADEIVVNDLWQKLQ